MPIIWGSVQVGLLSVSPAGGEGTIFKMYVQFNIPDFILIFVPNIWESYQIGLLSLGPVEPRGGRASALSRFSILENSRDFSRSRSRVIFISLSLLDLDFQSFSFHFHFSKRVKGTKISPFFSKKKSEILHQVS